MPVYEFRCLDCQKRFDVFLSYSEYGAKQVLCAHCGSAHVQRRIGRVRIARSDQTRLEDLASGDDLSSVDEDPRALGRMMRQMSEQVGEELPPEFNEVVDRLERGQDPEQIERELPDLAGGDEGGSDLF